MLPGPDRIVACPNCSALAKYMTLQSGNTIGAELWTDGHRIAPMMPRPPAVVACHACGACYWLADARVVGEIEPNLYGGKPARSANPAHAAAPEVAEPDEDTFYRALGTGLAATPEQQRTVRILAWWRSNDAARARPKSGAAAGARESEARRANLEALAALLDEGDEDDRIRKAEVCRELGDFAPALALLERCTTPDCARVVGQLRSLCEARDTRVRRFQFD